MRRNIIDQKAVNYFSIVFLFAYLPICSIYPTFSPLLAISFLLFSKYKENSFYVFFIFIFLFLLDISFGFMPFSSIVFFIIFNKYISPNIRKISPSAKVTTILKVFTLYFGYLIFSFLLSVLLDADFLDINILYIIYYILFDIIIALVFMDE